MERLEEQIHLRNIVSCLTELGDYIHYLSYERYLLDKELKKIIIDNLIFAASEASSLYKGGCKVEGLQYLSALKDSSAIEKENYAIYSLLQNDIDYLAQRIKEACESESAQAQLYKRKEKTFA